MIVCIFSFNRGRYLEHCVSSIETCAPHWSICIVDDDSWDPDTRVVLERLENRHRVIRVKNRSGRKLGGLYPNMQRALETFAEEPLLMFLQDDMQLVRPIDDRDDQFLQSYFDEQPDAGFLQPCFLKGCNRERDKARVHYDPDHRVYRRDPAGQSAGIHFSAVSITSPRRLMANHWHFGRSEPANDHQAAQRFSQQGQLRDPFAMWLPDVPAYRGKRKTLALRLAEKKRGCGFYPFETLDAEQCRSLRERADEVLPFAEDFLQVRGGAPQTPWAYYPLQDSRWLKKLNSWELGLRRLLRLT